MTAPRHSWSEPKRFLRKTERFCARCGLVKVTRHEGDLHWVEWWRSVGPAPGDVERIKSERTPTCVAVEVRAA